MFCPRDRSFAYGNRTAQSLNLKHMSCAFSVANSHFLALSWLQSALNMAWFRVSPDSLLSRLSIALFWLGLVTLRLFRLILSLCHSQVVFAMVRGFSSTLAAFLLTVQLSSVSVFSGGDLSPRTDTFYLLGLARYPIKWASASSAPDIVSFALGSLP